MGYFFLAPAFREKALLILYFVHWRWHRFDLSLDAVIKYFAVGFLIVFFLCIVVEQAFFAVNNTLLVFSLSYLVKKDLDQNPKDFDEFINDQGLFMLDFAWSHKGVFVLYYFVESFVVAAAVKEICKYFGYWMVEQPDLTTTEAEREGLRREGKQWRQLLSQRSPAGGDGPGPNHDFVDHHEGLAGYDVGAGDNNEETGLPTSDTIRSDAAGITAPTSSGSRSLNSTGAGVTIAMVSVALGFSTCENLAYIFLLSPSNFGAGECEILVQPLSRPHPSRPLCVSRPRRFIDTTLSPPSLRVLSSASCVSASSHFPSPKLLTATEFSTLLVRSIMPIHPLAAAIQSIGICRRDLEGDTTVGMGRIVLPGLLLHGLFDFAITTMGFLHTIDDMAVDVGDIHGTDGGGFNLATQMPSLVLGMVFIIAGTVYFVFLSMAQKTRLNFLEEARRESNPMDSRSLLEMVMV